MILQVRKIVLKNKSVSPFKRHSGAIQAPLEYRLCCSWDSFRAKREIMGKKRYMPLITGDVDLDQLVFGSEQEREKKCIGSLRQKALLVIAGICLLVLVSVGSSLWFALVTESDAAAINISGSLRMQSWRLAEHVLIPELTSQDTLDRLIDIYDNSINSEPLRKLLDDRGDLGEAYRRVASQWFVQMKPLLADPHGYEAFVYQVPEFVDRIDHMVNSLQLHTEQKLRQLFLTALFGLVGILFMALMTVRFINHHLLKPMDELGNAASLIQHGQFSGLGLNYQASNEIGNLTRTFRGMALELGNLYGHLEEKVEQQTQALAQSNHALELLYKASRNLATNPYDERLVASLVREWQELLDLEDCYLCLSDTEDSTRLQRIASDRKKPCAGEHCLDCLNKTVAIQVAEPGSWQFALLSKQHRFGFLQVTAGSATDLSEESQQWLQTFADIIATAIDQSRAKTHERRMLLMEERAVIARELHDSLAQALSYQKIQSLRLKRQLEKLEVQPQVMGILDELREGTNNAYAQLRELLRTFRLTLSEGGLEQALQKTLEEFSQRSPKIHFQLDYQLRFSSIDAHDQIHALQIVREALMNVVKHAKASEARVSCFITADGALAITVTDDGCGIEAKPSSHGHYGTAIMRERAASMGGILDIRTLSPRGTEVYLEFGRSEERTYE
ncbi:histidine kinase [Endozoicomonas sp. SCSIO W0465]|uniref:histidine kinase n=1 Tax=Endozoicomonas sp. SCSIO W0465 TaxID=2918516 RepID=UPI002075A883|nr:histidine kinase [Endozoicomonas sp. SCSIO W0465]USE34306.1 histidine kinase [Endozoicomonas sp. SCSIO W0465]